MSGDGCEGCLEWKEFDAAGTGPLPDGAVYGGSSNSRLFIGRVRAPEIIEGLVLPAVINENNDTAYFTWGSAVGGSGKFEVLVSKHVDWEDGWQDGQVPKNAVIGGWCSLLDRIYYIGRVFLNDEGWLVPGRIDPAEQLMYIPYNNEEKPYKSYQVLVMNDCTCENS